MMVDMAIGPNRLFRGRPVAPGASRSNGKPGCRAAIAPLPGGNGAVAGMGAGFYIGLSYLVRGDAVNSGCQVRFCQVWWCQAK